MDHENKEKAARLFLLMIIPWNSEGESISCHFLLKPTRDINYTLVACGLQEWAIQQKEESTLAKIDILYTLALAAKEYSDGNRKISREVMEKAGRDELSKINCLINNGITTFPRV